MGTFAELALCICNKSTQPVPFRCTCALLGFHSVTVLTPIRARWWRSRLAGQICQSLVLWQCVWPSVCYLSERCEERFCGGKRTTVCLVSVKVRHWFAWREKEHRSMWISSHYASMLCLQFAFSSCVCFAGDYFGILFDEKVTVFPFNIMENPMYWGSTANYLGLALM